MSSPKLSHTEIEAAHERGLEFKASSSIEGIEYTAEEEAMFEDFRREGLSPEECRARIGTYLERLVAQQRRRSKTA